MGSKIGLNTMNFITYHYHQHLNRPPVLVFYCSINVETSLKYSPKTSYKYNSVIQKYKTLYVSPFIINISTCRTSSKVKQRISYN